jgi:phosphatidylglycerophosphate synthase
VIAGAALVQVQSILDGCDGELARLKMQGSRLGEWLDNVIDDAINVVYAVALGHAAAVLLGVPAYRSVGLFAGGGFAIYAAVLYAHLGLVCGRGDPFLFRWWFQKQDTYVGQSLASSRVVSVIHAMGRRDLFLFAFLVLCAARQPHVAVLWYAAVALVLAVLAVVHLLAGGIAKARSARHSLQ